MKHNNRTNSKVRPLKGRHSIASLLKQVERLQRANDRLRKRHHRDRETIANLISL